MNSSIFDRVMDTGERAEDVGNKALWLVKFKHYQPLIGQLMVTGERADVP